VRIEYVGSLSKGQSLKCGHIIMYYLSIPTSSSFPWKSIWRVKAPLRVAFFVWMVALGKILILDSLRKRNVIVVYWCCTCKKSV
jgi:hypothetical protein